MAVYTYEALGPDGREVSGNIEAGDSKEAISMLRRKGIFPTRVRRAKGGAIEAKVETGKPSQQTTSENRPDYMFGENEYRCKYIHETGVDAGCINIYVRNKQTYISFKGSESGELLINLNDVSNTNIKGLLGNKLVVNCSGREYVFKGGVKTIGRILQFELVQRDAPK